MDLVYCIVCMVNKKKLVLNGRPTSIGTTTTVYGNNTKPYINTLRNMNKENLR